MIDTATMCPARFSPRRIPSSHPTANYGLRRLTKHRGAFPSDEALIELLYLALCNISKRWTLPIRDWKAALNRFTIQLEERIPQL